MNSISKLSLLRESQDQYVSKCPTSLLECLVCSISSNKKEPLGSLTLSGMVSLFRNSLSIDDNKDTVLEAIISNSESEKGPACSESPGVTWYTNPTNSAEDEEIYSSPDPVKENTELVIPATELVASGCADTSDVSNGSDNLNADSQIN